MIYEPTPSGRPRLLGADFLVFADAWTAKHPEGPPELMGQLFHLFESPNRFGLPAFYTLHVWAWKQNPKGVVCELAPRRFLRAICRASPLTSDGICTWDGFFDLQQDRRSRAAQRQSTNTNSD